jgi:diguanylate cyclase (GGDEF)-like protein
MTEALRESDYLARLGGDEFLVVIPQVSDEETARRVADKLIASVGVPYQLGSRSANVTLSVGVTLFPRDGRDRETLMKCADQALYQAKHAGKNQAVFYQPDQRITNRV